MRRKPDCGFNLYFVKHVLEFLILIHVLYKSGVNLNSYGLWFYSHVLICLSMDKWTLCGQFYLYVEPVWSLYNIGKGCHVIAQVVFFGIALRSKETARFLLNPGSREKDTQWYGARLPGIHESSAG